MRKQRPEESLSRLQEVTAIVGKCAGVVLLAPPRESAEAQATIATLLSSMKPKQKVLHPPCLHYAHSAISDLSSAETPLNKKRKRCEYPFA